MTTSPQSADAPRAYLYNSDLEPTGHVGVVVLPAIGPDGLNLDLDVAVFSPWPDSVSEGTPFAVRVEVSGPPPATHWRRPVDVEHVRAIGRNEETNVVLVKLEGQPLISTRLPQVARGLDSRVVNSAGIRQALIEHYEKVYNSPTEPSPLGLLSTPVVASDDLDALGGSQPTSQDVSGALGVPLYSLHTGDDVYVQMGICRILHWD